MVNSICASDVKLTSFAGVVAPDVSWLDSVAPARAAALLLAAWAYEKVEADCFESVVLILRLCAEIRLWCDIASAWCGCEALLAAELLDARRKVDLV